MVIDFLLSNARLVLGVGGAAVLGIATLAVKRVSDFEVVSYTPVRRIYGSSMNPKSELTVTKSYSEFTVTRQLK